MNGLHKYENNQIVKKNQKKFKYSDINYKAKVVMNLQGINVLVDGYNLEMTKGTGIKTYGLSLIKALVSLEANVDLLCSRYTNGNDLFLNEVLFFDRQKYNDSNLKLKTILTAFTKRFYYAEELQISNFVIKQDVDSVFDYLGSSGQVFNIVNCYKIVNNLYKYFYRVSKIKIKKKIDIWHETYPLPIRVNDAK
ncbi:MAG: hypothetical protein F6K62_24825, partial [Sphaerospermopsis sp. SIO1G2]|nr:hypothetical protein [Sphaerospermopsis sp. SIO1G2]